MKKKNNNKMRIGILVRIFPNIVQTYVLNHILSMKNSGMGTLVVAETKPRQTEIHPAIIDHSLLDETVYVDTKSNQITKQISRLPLTNIKYIGAVLRIIFSGSWKRQGIRYTLKSMIRAQVLAFGKLDIIHSHSLFSSYYYLFLSEIFSIPFTTTFHGLVPNNVRMLEKDKIQKVLDAGDAFFVNTRFASEQLIGFGCQPKKIHVIPQGIVTDDFPFRERKIDPDNPIIILSVGRLSIEKGFHTAILAIERLKSRFNSIEYRIVGSGPEDKNLKELIQSLDLHDIVKLCGSVSTVELLNHYNEAGIFILPSIDLRDGSHTETQGVVLQEAQASGIPVIASRTGGIPEVVKHKMTGLLFDEKNDEELASLIESLVTSSDLYNKLCLQARDDVENNYSIEIIRDRLIRVYMSILDA